MEKVSAIIELEVDNGTPVLRPRGEYSDTETYVFDTDFRDYVYRDVTVSGGGKERYYFVVKNQFDTLKGVVPVVDNNVNNRWAQSKKAEFIAAKSITADMLAAGSVTAEKLSVAGFNFENNNIWGGAKFGQGEGIDILSNTGDRAFRAYKDGDNYVEMFMRTGEWGLKGVIEKVPVFQLGSTNKIGPFRYTGSLLVADNPYVLDNGYSYEGGLTLSPNHIYFKYAMSSIYQQSVYIGVKGQHGNSSYGENTVLAVEGGDIWHQSGKFYASDINMRGDLKMYPGTSIIMESDGSNAFIRVPVVSRRVDIWSNTTLALDQTVVYAPSSTKYNVVLPSGAQCGHTVVFLGQRNAYLGIIAPSGGYISYKGKVYGWIDMQNKDITVVMRYNGTYWYASYEELVTGNYGS